MNKKLILVLVAVVVIGLALFMWKDDLIKGGNLGHNTQTYTDSIFNYSVTYPQAWDVRSDQNANAASQNIATNSQVQFLVGEKTVAEIKIGLRPLAEQVEKSTYSVSNAQMQDVVINGNTAVVQKGQLGGKGEPYRDTTIVYIKRDATSHFSLELKDNAHLADFEALYQSFVRK